MRGATGERRDLGPIAALFRVAFAPIRECSRRVHKTHASLDASAGNPRGGCHRSFACGFDFIQAQRAFSTSDHHALAVRADRHEQILYNICSHQVLGWLDRSWIVLKTRDDISPEIATGLDGGC